MIGALFGGQSKPVEPKHSQPSIEELVSERDKDGLQQVLVVCMPKSGSTFITQKIAALPNFQSSCFVPAYGRREQELDSNTIYTALLNNRSKNLVAHHHTMCSEETLRLLSLFNIRPVVQMRNIMDCLASVVDHWSNESTIGPGNYWNEELLEQLDQAGISRLEAATVTTAHWYIRFFLTWTRDCMGFAPAQAPILIQYEDFFLDPKKSLNDLYVRLGYKLGGSVIDSMLTAKAETRFNKGIIGRGVEMFKKDTRAREALMQQLRVYPNVDFGRIVAWDS